MWLDLTTTHRQTWLFSSTSTYHSTDLLTARGVAHLVVHGITGSTSYETIPHVRLESCGGVLSTVDMVVQRRSGPRRLRDHDDDDDDDDDDDELGQQRSLSWRTIRVSYCCKFCKDYRREFSPRVQLLLNCNMQPPTHAATPPRPLCESSLWTRRQEVDATSHSDARTRAGGCECVCRLLSVTSCISA